MKARKCLRCSKKLANHNKSGYCTKCYTKSPQFLEYQRIKQSEWYAKPENKIKRKLHARTPRVVAYTKKYHKIWVSENIERNRELKRNWERKNREGRRAYTQRWRTEKKLNLLHQGF